MDYDFFVRQGQSLLSGDLIRSDLRKLLSDMSKESESPRKDEIRSSMSDCIAFSSDCSSRGGCQPRPQRPEHLRIRRHEPRTCCAARWAKVSIGSETSIARIVSSPTCRASLRKVRHRANAAS